ncbi:uncharacterized protein LOC143229207 isoform X2 [Tachypleus tridentatus]|uniref:uncharacterized protein LOC143229207 isoform X2 n=1 Tax=Tachypleus tridentatus TaxID=6853 RepID=UPI003FD09771
MIPYVTCVCTKTTRNPQKWLTRTTLSQTLVETELEKDGKYCVRFKALNINKEKLSLAGKQFHTLHRYRIRFPVTKPEVSRIAILHDTNDGITQYLLSSCWKWNFSAFSLDVATGGRSVSVLLLHLFHYYGFIKKFRLDALKIVHCFSLVESGYHSNNPYHNAVHASDVTQALHCFLQEETISRHVTPLEVMASLIAAVCHDLDHPGFTQPFLIATSNHLAVLYKNFSVLETHHWRMAISCLRESKLLDHLERDVCVEIEWWVRSMILATDISRQQDFLVKLKKYMEESSLDLSKKDKRHFILQVALKCADLSNPCRPWPISKQWSYQVCEELYRQGEVEIELRLPITRVCDRTKTSVARIQSDFLRFVVSPLFEMWHLYLKSYLSHDLMCHLHHNQAHWDELLQQELEELNDTSSVLGIAAMASEDFAPLASEEEDSLEDCASLYCESLLVDNSLNSSMHRRYSLPMKKVPSMKKTAIRRQSFPLSLVSHMKSIPSGWIPFYLRNIPSCSSNVTASGLLESKTSIVSLFSEFDSSVSQKIENEAGSGQICALSRDRLFSTIYGNPSFVATEESAKSHETSITKLALVETSGVLNEKRSYTSNSSEPDCDTDCCSRFLCQVQSNNFLEDDILTKATPHSIQVNNVTSSRTLFLQGSSVNYSSTKYNEMISSNVGCTKIRRNEYFGTYPQDLSLGPKRTNSATHISHDDITFVSSRVRDITNKQQIFRPCFINLHSPGNERMENNDNINIFLEFAGYLKEPNSTKCIQHVSQRRGSAPDVASYSQPVLINNEGFIIKNDNEISFDSKWKKDLDATGGRLGNIGGSPGNTVGNHATSDGGQPPDCKHSSFDGVSKDCVTTKSRTKLLRRRHSFAILETIPSPQSGSTFSDTDSKHIPDCYITRKHDNILGTFLQYSPEGAHCYSGNNANPFLPFGRRGSLPSDIGLAWTCRIQPLKSFPRRRRAFDGDIKAKDFVSREQTSQGRRRGSTGDMVVNVVGSMFDVVSSHCIPSLNNGKRGISFFKTEPSKVSTSPKLSNIRKAEIKYCSSLSANQTEASPSQAKRKKLFRRQACSFDSWFLPDITLKCFSSCPQTASENHEPTIIPKDFEFQRRRSSLPYNMSYFHNVAGVPSSYAKK